MADLYFEMLKEQALTLRKKKRLLEQTELSIKEKIKKFFKENPYPEDSKVHDFADSMGIDPDKLESEIYSLLSDYLKVGKHQDSPDSNYDSKELAMGIEVEKEHVDDPMLTKEIAKDHLAEIPDYYTRLKKMEDEAKTKKD